MADIDVEDVGDKILAILQAQLPANLAAVDARKATQLDPDPPQDWIFGDVDQTPMLPAVVVTCHQTQEDLDEPGWRRQTYKVEIEVYYSAEDVEKCSRIIRRYGTAIDDTFKTSSGNNLVPDYWQSISNITQAFWDTMAIKDGGLFQVVRVSFDVAVHTD